MRRAHTTKLWLLGALLFALIALGYRYHQKQELTRLQRQNAQILQEIRETVQLQRIWNTRGVREQLEKLRRELPGKIVNAFDLRRRELHIRLKGLDSRLLNRVVTRLGALPLQFRELRIDRRGKSYALECRCAW